MCLVGSLSYLRGLLVILSQIVGAIAAAALVDGLLPGPLTVRTTLGGGISIVRGLFLEMFLTALVVLTVLLLAAERHRSNHLAPVGVGLSLFVAHLFGLYYTGASVNPARSFGPSVVMRDFEGHHWIYWVGPLLGSLVAASFYQILKSLEYEPLQPGQHVADAHHSDPTDAPRRYDDSDPAGDVDEYKRSGATHHAHTPAGLNGVNQGTTNDPARNNAYASGPGIEAGRH